MVGKVIGWYPQLRTPTSMDPASLQFEEHIKIHLDDPKTDPLTIQAHKRHPMRFEKHPVKRNYYCGAWRLEQNSMFPNVRDLYVTWTTSVEALLSPEGKPVYDNDPILRPISYDISSWEFSKTIRMTYKKTDAYDVKKGPPVPSVPVCTTAGEPIFMSIPWRSRLFNCERNVLRLPPFMSKCDMFTNSDRVRFAGVVYEPLQLLASNINLSRPMFEWGRVFYKMIWQMAVAPDEDGWCEKKRNAGYHEKRTVVVPRVGNDPGGTETFLDAIVIGPPEERRFPSSPILLTPEGRAYRSPGIGQTAATPQKDRTGPIIAVEGSAVGGLGGLGGVDFEKIWKDAELKFYPRMPIPFKKFIPLR